jgi:hypothetical protein
MKAGKRSTAEDLPVEVPGQGEGLSAATAADVRYPEPLFFCVPDQFQCPQGVCRTARSLPVIFQMEVDHEFHFGHGGEIGGDGETGKIRRRNFLPNRWADHLLAITGPQMLFRTFSGRISQGLEHLQSQ